MFIFESMRLNGTTPHNDTRIDFIDGINVVRGPNYSGKSTPFQLFTRLITGEFPYAAHKKAKDNTGNISLSFSKSEDYYETALDLVTGKPTIIENGRLLDYKKIPSAVAKMEEVLPFTLPSVQNFCYLSNDTFPYLLRGTPQQRKMLFEHLFDIDTSEQYKMFLAMDKNIRKLEHKKEALGALSYDPVLPQELVTLKARIATLVAQFKQLEPAYENCKEYEAARKEWAGHAGFFPKIADLSDKQLADRLKALDPSALRKEMKEAEAFDQYLEFREGHARLTKKRADIIGKLKGSPAKPKYMSELSGMELANLASLLEENVNLLKTDQPENIDISHLNAAVTKAERKLKALEHANECPLCGTTLVGKSSQKVLEAIKAELNDLLKEIAVKQKQKDTYLAAKSFISSLDRFMNWKDARFWCKHIATIKLFSAVQYIESDLCTVQESLDGLGEVVKTMKSRKNARTLDTIEQDVKMCLNERAAIESFQRFFALDRPAKDVNKDDLDNLRERISTLRDTLSEKTVQERNYRELRLETSKLRHQLRMKPVVSSLKHLYGPKGLRLAKVSDSLNEYIKNLNLLAPIVFNDYVFSADLSDTGIDIICKRKAGTSDVRRFSSSEGKLLPLLSLMALHPILPAERRTNLLVLDEVEASLDIASREKYVKLLPELQNLYPSLWVITPLTAKEFPIRTSHCPLTEYNVSMDKDGHSTIKSVNA